MNTCRFCKSRHNGMVRYSHTHYACWPCFLDNGKPLDKLVTAELRRIPWRIVRDRHLQAKIDAILAFREAGLDKGAPICPVDRIEMEAEASEEGEE